MKSHLKSGTALLVTLALVAPAPLLAQTTDAPFPCVAPNGEQVADAEQLAAVLADMTVDLTGDSTCAPELLNLAPMTDEADVLDTPVGEPIVEETSAEEPVLEEPVLEEAPVEEAPAEEPAVEEQATAEPPAEDAETPEEPVVQNAPAEEAVVEDAPAEEPVAQDAQVEEPAVEEQTAQEAPVEQDPTQEPVAEETPVEEPASQDAAPAETTVEETPQVEPVLQDPIAAEPTVDDVLVPNTNAETEVAPTQAGEAGGAQITDEERQEMTEARDDGPAETSAAAETATDESAGEVTTQTITEDDVRTSDEDFANSVNAAPEIDTDDRKKGLSNFEKALLLGLGAAAVGSLLSNGDQVVSNSGDRVVVERDGELRVLKNDDELLQRPGAQVQTQTFQDGSTRTVVLYEDSSQIVMIRSREGAVLRRTLIRASDGTEVVLFDDTKETAAVNFAELPTLESLEQRQRDLQASEKADLESALFANVGRSFSLQQVRDYKRVRALAPQVELEAVTFASGSAAIAASQAEALRDTGLAMRDIIEKNPSAVFLIEGHTDAVGAASYNLALSDRRAETVALALTEYFAVPPQNLITQGYGEADLKVRVLTDERTNRRAVVRNITKLLN